MNKIYLTKEYIKDNYPIIIKILIPIVMIFFGLVIIGSFCLFWDNDIAFYIPFGIFGTLSIFIFIIPNIKAITREFKLYNKVKKYEFEIKRCIIIDKNYALLEEISEEDIISGEADKDVVFLQDEDGNIVSESARVPEFVDSKIGDEYFRVMIRNEKIKTYYSSEKYYM